MTKSRSNDAAEINMGDLAEAVRVYIREKRITTTALAKKVGLENGPLGKFMRGDTTELRDPSRLIALLSADDYWPTTSKINIYRLFARFAQEGAAVPERPLQIDGTYKCFQWSETAYGKITVSKMMVGRRPTGQPMEAEEIQGHERKGETYKGFCFLSKQVIFVLKEQSSHQLKFIVCDSWSQGIITGIVLKSSDRKPVHVTNIFMRKTEEEILPNIDFESDVDDVEAKRYLTDEPLTPFDLYNANGFERAAKLDLIRAMVPFIRQKDSGDSR